MLCSQTLKYGQRWQLLLQCSALCSAKGMQHMTIMYTAETEKRSLSIACIQRTSFVGSLHIRQKESSAYVYFLLLEVTADGQSLPAWGMGTPP